MKNSWFQVCLANPSERSRFIRCIYSLLNSPSAAVRYEAAGTLVTLSSAPTAIKAAAGCYIELVVKESDNNVKLIVLDRLIAMKESPSHERVLQDLVMDILRVLGEISHQSIQQFTSKSSILNNQLFLSNSKQARQLWKFAQKRWLSRWTS